MNRASSMQQHQRSTIPFHQHDGERRAPASAGSRSSRPDLACSVSQRVHESEDMDEEVNAGCIVWQDDKGIYWCLDTVGAYGTPGSVSYLKEGQWCLSCGGKEDGCIYWEDESGSMWCRDVQGAHGPAGEQYHSQDGETWFGDSEAWLELADEAAEFFAARADTQMKRRVAAQSGHLARGRRDAKAWENDKRVMKIPRDEGDAEASAEERPSHKVHEANRRAMYGDEMLARIVMEEARMNAWFDSQVKQHKHVVWPEMPLKMS
jgi:hypothetical protein